MLGTSRNARATGLITEVAPQAGAILVRDPRAMSFPGRSGEHDSFFQTDLSKTTASLFDHCPRSLDQSFALTGTDGMPLIGNGDWNDGINRVGEAGQGTSLWLGWQLIAARKAVGHGPHAIARDPARAARCRAHAESLTAAIEDQGWVGAWYRRGSARRPRTSGDAILD